MTYHSIYILQDFMLHGKMCIVCLSALVLSKTISDSGH